MSINENSTFNENEKSKLDINSLSIDNYFVSDMKIIEDNLIVIYSGDSKEVKEPGYIISYDLNTYQVINKIVHEITRTTEIIMFDSIFYLYDSKLIDDIHCFDKNLNIITTFLSEKIPSKVWAINANANKIIYVKKDSSDSTVSFLCENDSSFNNEKEIFKIHQEKAYDIFSLKKIYFSKSGNKVGFLGDSFKSLSLNSESKHIYGYFDLITLKEEHHYRQNIDCSFYNGNMLIHYKEGYNSNLSKHDLTSIFNIDKNEHQNIDTHLSNESVEFSFLNASQFLVAEYDKKRSKKSYQLKFFDGNNLNNLNNKLSLNAETSNFKSVYNREKKILILCYIRYDINKKEIKYIFEEVNM